MHAVDPSSFEVAFSAIGDAVASPDWTRLVRAMRGAGETTLEVLDPATGDLVWEQVLPADLAVRVVAPHGDLVALSPSPAEGGQAATTLVIASLEGAPARTFELAGNYEPEAFAVDGSRLFVVEYTPPVNPARYQVRQLDLTTGQVGDVPSRDDELQEPMQGTARTQVGSPDGTRLYTFYATDEVQEEEGEEPYHGFIHVLDLEEGWAFCIDLPMPFGAGDEAAIGLAITPDGDHLYVADRTDGILAEVDTSALEVVRTHELPGDPDADTVAATVAGSDTMFLAGDDELIAVDLYSFTVLAGFPVEGPITSLHAGGRGTVLYAALPSRVAILDPVTGVELSSVGVPGVRAVGYVGALTPGVDALPTAQCGCGGLLT